MQYTSIYCNLIEFTFKSSIVKLTEISRLDCMGAQPMCRRSRMSGSSSKNYLRRVVSVAVVDPKACRSVVEWDGPSFGMTWSQHVTVLSMFLNLWMWHLENFNHRFLNVPFLSWLVDTNKLLVGEKHPIWHDQKENHTTYIKKKKTRWRKITVFLVVMMVNVWSPVARWRARIGWNWCPQ